MLLYRWDAPLFFANAARFEIGRCTSCAAGTASPVDGRGGRDDHRCRRHGGHGAEGAPGRARCDEVVFAFAELKGPVWDQLKQYGLAQRIGEDHRFPTIGTTVKRTSGAGTHWVDPVPD